MNLYIDAFSGISGDKMVAALLSLEDNLSFLKSMLDTLPLQNEYKIEVYNKLINGINSLKFDVILQKNHHHTHTHQHRNIQDIYKLIDESKLTTKAKEISKGIFKIIGKAEAFVHNKKLEEVHFHEVGAIDSIIDIVSVAILIDRLNIDKIFCSSIPLGNGFVETSHGILPVPAPATAEILKGIPVYQSDIQEELTTPTGAAIVKYLVNDFIELNEAKIIKIGYGAGTKNLKIPNFLRLFLLQDSNIQSQNGNSDKVNLLETEVDDITGENVGFLIENLLDNGALDVFITPIIMKKSRPGFLISVLCKIEDKEKIVELIFKNSSTFGIRKKVVDRIVLKREFKEIIIENQPIKIKLGYYKDKLIQKSFEYEDIKKAATNLNLSFNEILNKLYHSPDF